LSDVIDGLFFRKGQGGLLEAALWFCLGALIIIFTMNAVYWGPEFAEEKTKLKTMSCKDLGQWLIDNSNRGAGKDVDVNYAYAQAKYLVCTHSGVPST